jgi:purine-binding chemotaxis protein CheW
MKTIRIDWQAARARVQANEQALEYALVPNPQRIDNVLRQRAVELAQAKNRQAPVSAGLPVLEFRLGQGRYAIEMEHLAEVVPLTNFAPVPRSPAHFLGMISVRGELRPVVDLKFLLGQGSDETGNSGFVLLLHPHASGEQIGLKADSVDQVREIRPEELTQISSGVFVAALKTESEKNAIALLDVDALWAHVLFSETTADASSVLPGHEMLMPATEKLIPI